MRPTSTTTATLTLRSFSSASVPHLSRRALPLSSPSLLRSTPTRARLQIQPRTPAFSPSPSRRSMSSSTAAPAPPSEMKAILIKDGKGPSSSLYIGSHAVPTLDPSSSEVLVRIRAFGLNRMDILQREGKYPLPPSAPKDIMGVEFSGEVVASTCTSESPDSPAVGEQVFGLATGGAYAEYIRVPARMVLRKPAGLSHAQAAAIPEAFLTAYQALVFIARLAPGEDVLVHAGASGVGLAAVQLARALGARNVYVTAGSAEKISVCQEVGATQGFNYKDGDWAAELAAATKAAPGGNPGVDVVLDFIGAPYYAGNIASLRRDGRMVMLAFMGGAKVKECDLSQLLFKRLHIEGTTLRSRDLEYQSRLVQDFVKSGALDKLARSAGSGSDDEHRIMIHKVYDWKDIKEAHDEMEANKNTGKIIMTIGEQ